ncbi:hypothetical protein [Inquilinus sp. OTU3971]|uniref:hypothetical protein n=1 Tax=Inquilinus sp. OTU3971 TaxID=3043855 RepID=UPI00313B9E00
MRSTVVLAVAAALGLAGCNTSQQKPAGPTITMQTTPQPGDVVAGVRHAECRTPRDRPGNYRYSGGPGDRLETAIVIEGALTEVSGVSAEYVYVARHLPGWAVCGQALVNPGSRVYDQLDLANDAGHRRSIFFDITSWFGKLY